MVLLADRKFAKRERPADLPNFKNPPVEEVVLGVQFSDLRKYRTVHPGLLWDSKFRQEFPKFLEMPRLASVFEIFGGLSPGDRSSGPALEVVGAPGASVPRLWFMNERETELLQIQSDRFIHNWKEGATQEPYPHYEQIRDKFFDELNKVEDFFEKQEIGLIEPNQCEIIYVNHIALPDGTDPGPQLEKILAIMKPIDYPLAGPRTGAVKQKTENLNLGMRSVMLDSSGEPCGRLHVQVIPLTGADGEPVIRMELTARGAPMRPGYQGIADFLDLGREIIVWNFANLTTKEMHAHWGRIQ